MPEFSIIIPVYNSESSLRKCLASVLEQTFQDFEVLCCYDDCKDGSKEIILEYSNHDNRVKFIQGRNKGLSAARNDGINAVCGKYILFLDSDDTFNGTAVFRIKQEFDRRNCDIVVFGTEIESSGIKIPSWYYGVLNTPDRFYKFFTKKALFAEKSARPFVWRNAFSSSFIKKNKLFFDEECLVGEDQVFQLCSFPLADNGIAFIKDKLYRYTCGRSGSLMDIYDKDIVFKLSGHLKMVEHVFAWWSIRNFNRLSEKDIAIWSVYFLAPEITSLSQEKIDLLAEPLKLLFTDKRISDEIIGSFPKIVQKIALALKNCQAYTQTKTEIFLFKLWWYLHWGSWKMIISDILSKCWIYIKK